MSAPPNHGTQRSTYANLQQRHHDRPYPWIGRIPHRGAVLAPERPDLQSQRDPFALLLSAPLRRSGCRRRPRPDSGQHGEHAFSTTRTRGHPPIRPSPRGPTYSPPWASWMPRSGSASIWTATRTWISSPGDTTGWSCSRTREAQPPRCSSSDAGFFSGSGDRLESRADARRSRRRSGFRLAHRPQRERRPEVLSATPAPPPPPGSRSPRPRSGSTSVSMPIRGSWTWTETSMSTSPPGATRTGFEYYRNDGDPSAWDWVPNSSGLRGPGTRRPTGTRRVWSTSTETDRPDLIFGTSAGPSAVLRERRTAGEPAVEREHEPLRRRPRRRRCQLPLLLRFRCRR